VARLNVMVWEGYFPETLNTKGNFHIGKSQQPSITSLLPLPSTSSFLSLSRLNPTISPSQSLHRSLSLLPSSEVATLLPLAAISLAETLRHTSTLLCALAVVSTPPNTSPVLHPDTHRPTNIDPFTTHTKIEMNN